MLAHLLAARSRIMLRSLARPRRLWLLALMSIVAPTSPEGCGDKTPECTFFAANGECGRRQEWMASNCRHSCGTCPVEAQHSSRHEDLWAQHEHLVHLKTDSLVGRFRRSNKCSLVLFHSRWDVRGRETRASYASTATHTASHEGAPVVLAAVDCDDSLVDHHVCAEFTAGRAATPSVWCFLNGNWSYGQPVAQQMDAVSMDNDALLDFASHCAQFCTAQRELAEKTRFTREGQAPTAFDQQARKQASTLAAVREARRNVPPVKAQPLPFDAAAAKAHAVTAATQAAAALMAAEPSPESPWQHRDPRAAEAEFTGKFAAESLGRGSGDEGGVRGERHHDATGESSRDAGMVTKRASDAGERGTRSHPKHTEREARIQERIARKMADNQRQREQAVLGTLKSPSPPPYAPPPPPPPPPLRTPSAMMAWSWVGIDQGDLPLDEVPADLKQQNKQQHVQPPAAKGQAAGKSSGAGGMSRFLAQLSLGAYHSALADLGVAMPGDIALVTEQEFSDMGMRPVEKRKLKLAANKVREL